jgi:hypothetical protein
MFVLLCHVPRHILAVVVVTAGLLVQRGAQLLVGGAALRGLHCRALLHKPDHPSYILLCSHMP